MAKDEIDVTEEYEFDNNNLEWEQFLQRLVDNADEIIKNINEGLARAQEIELQKIADNAVDFFYGDYTPGSKQSTDNGYKTNKKGKKYKARIYKRKGDLKHAYKIYVEDDEFFGFFGPQYMQAEHHQSNDYVYWATFIAGSHGGSHGGPEDDYAPDGIDPSSQARPDLYWRTGEPPFSRWYSEPAPKIKDERGSILNMILDDWDQYLDGGEYAKDKERIIENEIAKYRN